MNKGYNERRAVGPSKSVEAKCELKGLETLVQGKRLEETESQKLEIRVKPKLNTHRAATPT